MATASVIWREGGIAILGVPQKDVFRVLLRHIVQRLMDCPSAYALRSMKIVFGLSHRICSGTPPTNAGARSKPTTNVSVHLLSANSITHSDRRRMNHERCVDRNSSFLIRCEQNPEAWVGVA
jgi:hypothetical protein